MQFVFVGLRHYCFLVDVYFESNEIKWSHCDSDACGCPFPFSGLPYWTFSLWFWNAIKCQYSRTERHLLNLTLFMLIHWVLALFQIFQHWSSCCRRICKVVVVVVLCSVAVLWPEGDNILIFWLLRPYSLSNFWDMCVHWVYLEEVFLRKEPLG